MNSALHRNIFFLLFFLILQTSPTQSVVSRNVEDIFNTAVEHYRSGEYSKSIPYLRSYLKQYPSHENAAFLLSLCLLFQEKKTDLLSYKKDCREAASILKKSVKLFEYELGQKTMPQTAVREFYLGLAFWFSGRSDLARSAFQSSLMHDPDLKEAAFNIQTIDRELQL